MSTKPRVVAIGGGHGLAATIRAAKDYAGAVTAAVATADDGGSTGRLRSGLALPAPGDLRRCVVAMADPGAAPFVAALEYRFGGTDVEGHALGNLVLAGLTAVTGDFVSAAAELSRLAGVDSTRARVLPVTAEPVVLYGSTVDGFRVTGQVAIARTTDIDRVWTEPATAPVPSAVVDDIVDADQIVLGPGSLFTSVLAATAPAAVRHALADARGQRVYVCNLRAEVAETRGYDVAAHVRALRRHGLEPDVVVVQASGALAVGQVSAEVIEADLARPHGLAHDSVKLAAVLRDLVP